MTPKDKKVSEKDRILEMMRDIDPRTTGYEKLMNQYKILCEIEAKKPRVSPDAWAQIIANLAGILLILKHEELNVISSKALNFVIKGRL